MYVCASYRWEFVSCIQSVRLQLIQPDHVVTFVMYMFVFCFVVREMKYIYMQNNKLGLPQDSVLKLRTGLSIYVSVAILGVLNPAFVADLLSIMRFPLRSCIHPHPTVDISKQANIFSYQFRLVFTP